MIGSGNQLAFKDLNSMASSRSKAEKAVVLSNKEFRKPIY